MTPSPFHSWGLDFIGPINPPSEGCVTKTVLVTSSPTICQYFWKKKGDILFALEILKAAFEIVLTLPHLEYKIGGVCYSYLV